MDTWWQTETGMMLISPLPGITATKPGSATRPFPGIVAEVVDAEGEPVGPGRGRLPGAEEAVAGDDAHDLRRSRSLRAAILVALSGRLFHRRRLQGGRGRLFLAARPRGRRNERRRPPHLHLRSGERAGGSSCRGRSRGDRQDPRGERAGHLGVRDLEGRHRLERRLSRKS